MTLSSKEAEDVEFSSWSQEVKFISMLLVETTEVQKPSVIYEDIQSAIFLANNR